MRRDGTEVTLLEGSIDIAAPSLSATVTKQQPIRTSLEGSITIGGALLSAEVTKVFALNSFNRSGLQLDFLALLEATGEYDGGTDFVALYADSDRGGSGVPLDGELGMGTGETVISWIRWNGTQFILNDNNSPVALNIGGYFDTGGAGNDLFLYVQTESGGVGSVRVRGNVVATGGGFVRIGANSLAPIINNISVGDRFIIAAARPVPVIALEGTSSIGPAVLSAQVTQSDPASIPLEGQISVGSAALSAQVVKSDPPRITLEGSTSIGSAVLSAQIQLVSREATPLEGTTTIGSASLSAEITKVAPLATDLEGQSSIGSAVLSVTDLSISNPARTPLEGSVDIGAALLSAEITIRVAELLLSNLNTTGLIVDCAALLEATQGNETTGIRILYADSNRDGDDVPLDGELGLSDSNTLISRIRWNGSELLINDNNNPVALTLSDYFGSGGVGSDLDLYVQTQSGVASFSVSGNIPGAGGNYIRFSPSSDAATILDGIATGERFIIAFARSSNIALEGSIGIGRPTLSAQVTKSEPPTTALEGSIGIGNVELSSVSVTLAAQPTTPLEGSTSIGSATLSATLNKTDLAKIALEGSTQIGALVLSAGRLELADVEGIALEGSATIGAATLSVEVILSDALPNALEGSISIGAAEVSVADLTLTDPPSTPLQGSTDIGAAVWSNAEITLTNPPSTELEGQSEIGAATLSARLALSNPNVTPLEGRTKIGAVKAVASIRLIAPDSIPVEGSSSIGAVVLSWDGDLSLSGPPAGIALEGSSLIGAPMLRVVVRLKAGFREEEIYPEGRHDTMRVFSTISALLAPTSPVVGEEELPDSNQKRQDIPLPSIVFSYGDTDQVITSAGPHAFSIEIEYSVRDDKYNQAIDIDLAIVDYLRDGFRFNSVRSNRIRNCFPKSLIRMLNEGFGVADESDLAVYEAQRNFADYMGQCYGQTRLPQESRASLGVPDQDVADWIAASGITQGASLTDIFNDPAWQPGGQYDGLKLFIEACQKDDFGLRFPLDSLFFAVLRDNSILRKQVLAGSHIREFVSTGDSWLEELTPSGAFSANRTLDLFARQ